MMPRCERKRRRSLAHSIDRATSSRSRRLNFLHARSRGRAGPSRPGDRIGVYIVERRIGAGGMGEVWRGRDERLDRPVAIKLLLPHSSGADERMQAFEREARAAGSLNHPGVLTVYDVGDHAGAPYLVTECLDGESLRARIAAGPVPVDTALDIAIQTARGVAAAHSRGIVHRDLKPENIFLTPDGRVKVLDFGLAAWHGTASGHGRASRIPALRARTCCSSAPPATWRPSKREASRRIHEPTSMHSASCSTNC